MDVQNARKKRGEICIISIFGIQNFILIHNSCHLMGKKNGKCLGYLVENLNFVRIKCRLFSSEDRHCKLGFAHRVASN